MRAEETEETVVGFVEEERAAGDIMRKKDEQPNAFFFLFL